jgi:uncharacterized protein (TIGR02145 family)
MKRLPILVVLIINTLFIHSQDSYIQVVAEPDISVFLDGKFRGKTTADVGGLILEDLSKGRYTVKVVKEGFQPQEETIILKKGEVRQYKVRPFVPEVEIVQSGNESEKAMVQKTGGIRIQSLPVTIHIIIPELQVNSPKTEDVWEARNIPEGSYSVTFTWNDKSMDDYIFVDEGKVTSVLVNMVKGEIVDQDPVNVKGEGTSVETGSFIDERDDQTYPWVKIGTQVWMAENLNYVKRKEGWCYNENPSNCPLYGRLYDWETAVEICPEGWHLPDDKEWDLLISYLGGESFAGRKLLDTGQELWQSPRITASNESGFAALPAGYRNIDGDYNNLGEFAYFWSSTDYGRSYAWFRYLGAQFAQVYRDGGLKEEGRSVRCLKD